MQLSQLLFQVVIFSYSNKYELPVKRAPTTIRHIFPFNLALEYDFQEVQIYMRTIRYFYYIYKVYYIYKFK